MKFELDENLGRRARELFESAGHAVETVASQGLSSSTDQNLMEMCRREACCLVTLDLDFGNPLRFKPSDCPGIVVLRLPPKPAFSDLLGEVQMLLAALANRTIAGKLWIVQRGRVREYQEPGQD